MVQQVWTILNLLFLSYAAASHDLNFETLETLGVACYPQDSCSSSAVRTFENSNCRCDSQCGRYNDCCIDASQQSRSSTPIPGLKCMPIAPFKQGVYAIGRCKRNWRGPQQVRQKCENANDVSDPFLVSPTTDIQNNKSYTNRYCAECNDAKISQLQTWSIMVYCPTLAAANDSIWNITNDYILEHLNYSTEYPYYNQWGLYYWNNTSQQDIFHTCDISFDLPSYLKNHVRKCRPDIISTCSPSWRREEIRRKCRAYMASTYYDSEEIVFRNPHCALCNNMVLDRPFCDITLVGRNKPPMSFTLLLDVNMRDGNRVGEVEDTRCSAGEKYDPFFKKCREVVCALPGYTLVENRCVRQ